MPLLKYQKISDLPEGTLPDTDLCIIGTGAAGTTLAHALRNSNLSITLLESGFEEFDFEAQTLSHFELEGRSIRRADIKNPFTEAVAKKEEAQLRALGGTLNIWGGRFKMFTPFDLRQWPITYKELLPYYEQIAKEYQVEELFQNNEELPLLSKECPSLFSSITNKEKPAPHLQDKYRECGSSPTIHLYLGATVTKIEVKGGQVDHLVIKSLDGKSWRHSSKMYALCGGTIENTRLILASQIANDNPHVGKYLMDHPKGDIGLFLPFPKNRIIYEAKFHESRPFQRTYYELALAPSLLEECKIPNHCIRLTEKRGTLVARLFLEQLPNPASHITLSSEKDALGMPRALLRWQFSEEDKRGLSQFVEKMNSLFVTYKLGSLLYDRNIFSLDFLSDASHQMGTLRMGHSEKEGVVDGNCRLFGVNNLYIGGSAVFRTAGNANPTMTIMALALRLADHLRVIYKKI